MALKEIIAPACALVLFAGGVEAASTPKPLRLTIPPPGQFVGKFELVPLEQRCLKRKPGARETFVAKCPVLRNGHQFYAVRNTYDFRTLAGDYVTVFGGMTTDLASTPSLTWSTLPPDGPGAKEFPVHDAGYSSGGTYSWHGKVGRTRKAPYTRAEVDEILRQEMVALQVPAWKRIVVFEGVRIGGSRGWNH